MMGEQDHDPKKAGDTPGMSETAPKAEPAAGSKKAELTDAQISVISAGQANSKHIKDPLDN
jgi:hypothetical protein